MIYNLTLPIWSQLIKGKDVNDQNLTYYGMNHVTIGSNLTVNYSDLTKEISYNFYFGASNENYPRIYSPIYGFDFNYTNSQAVLNSFYNRFSITLSILIIALVFL